MVKKIGKIVLATGIGLLIFAIAGALQGNFDRITLLGALIMSIVVSLMLTFGIYSQLRKPGE